MKKLILGIIPLFILVMVFAGCAGNAKSTAGGSGAMALDDAIAEAARRIDNRVETGTKIAMINFSSPSDRFSTYVLDELTGNLVDTGNLTVVDRAEVDLIRGEFQFQLSGEVGDSSMQELGQMLGAQSIVSGSLTEVGSDYRLVIRVLNVQSAAVAVQFRTDILNSSRVQSLLQGGRSNRTSGTVTRTTTQPAAQAPAQAPAQATAQAPAQPGPLRDGIYSIRPRIRVTSAGVGVNLYLDRVVVRGQNFSVFFTGGTSGWGGDGEYGPFWSNLDVISLQNLATGQRYRPTNKGEDDDRSNPTNTGGFFVSFQGVTGSRFSISSSSRNPPWIVDSFTLGNPD